MADPSRPWTDAPGALEAPAVGVAPPALAPWLERLTPAARLALRAGAVALVGSWLGFYLITLWPAIALEAYRATILLHIATGLVLVPYLVSLVLRRQLPGGSALDVPVMAALAAYLLATATSLNWRVSLESSLYVLLAVSVFFVLSDAQLFRRWQVELGLMLAALAAALRALWVVGGDYIDWLQLTRAVEGGLSWDDLFPPTVPRVHDVSDHANILAMALATALPFFVVLLLRRSAAVRLLGLAGSLVLALALFLTLSRGAWLGALVGSAAVFALAAFLFPGRRAWLERFSSAATLRSRKLALVLGAAGLIVGLVAVLIVATLWGTRPEWLFRESASPRWDVLTTGGEVVQDYPLLGAGPDVFGLLYPEYSGKNPRYHYHVHNGFLQTAVDTGIPGVAAMLLLGGATAWLLLRSLRRASPESRLSLLACAGAVVAFGTHNLFDAANLWKAPLVTIAAVGAVAALAAREVEEETPEQAGEEERLDWGRLLHVGVRSAVPVAMAGLLITWGRLDLAHFHYSNGLGNANAQRWSEAADHARRAVELDPQFAIYRLQLGYVQARAYLETRDTVLLEEAFDELRRGVELEPRSAIGHVNLALLLADIGDDRGARSEALAAIRFANSDPAVVLAAAWALEEAGLEDEAVDAYAQALFLDVDLADSPFWRGSSFRRTHYREIVESSALVFNPCVLLRLATSGAPAGPLSRDEALAACRQQVAANPGDQHAKVTLAEALIEDGDFVEALSLLDGVLGRRPDFGPARTALGRWYAAQGDLAGARGQWLLGGQLDEVESLVLLGDSYPAGQVPSEVVDALRARLNEAASEVQFHLTGILYYRRSFYRGSPIDILLPGEWQQAVTGRYARARDALERWTGGD